MVRTMNRSADRTPEETDVRFHLHGFTDPEEHERRGPVIMERGRGIYLYDRDGRRYLDAMSSLWCCTLGYDDRTLIEAAYRQMRRLPYSHTFRGRSSTVSTELSEKLVCMAPFAMSKVFFACSGSEANESAIKLAWNYHRANGHGARRKILVHSGGYHGSTIFASVLSGLPTGPSRTVPGIADIVVLDRPHHFADAEPDEDEEAFASRLARRLEETIHREGPESIAALIAEPVMGVGGVVVPPRTYFEKIVAVLKRFGILVIADEVICGFGRTGNMFGSETVNMAPDIMTLAKGISSSYFPISAVLVSEPIYRALLDVRGDREGDFRHGFTNSGHPVGAAVALAAIAELDERNILENVRVSGARLQEGLRRLSSRPCVAEVRGVGLMAAVQFRSEDAGRPCGAGAESVGRQVTRLAETEMLFVRAVGDTVVLAPPLIIAPAEVDALIERFTRAVDALEDSPACQ